MVECAVADESDSIREVKLANHGRATIEGFLANSKHGIGKHQVAVEMGTILESVGWNGRNTCANVQGGERGAIGENRRRTATHGSAVEGIEVDRDQASATREGGIGDGSYVGRNGDRSHVHTILESIFVDGKDGIGLAVVGDR